MSKPLIGIVTTVGPDPVAPEERDVFYAGKPYVDCIIQAGGFPVLIPHGVDLRQAADLIDGWLIIGGRDIDPKHYGHQPDPALELESPERVAAEKSLYDVLPSQMPVLGICYGCQFLNVMRGGTLHQHVPNLTGHDQHSGGTLQNYELEATSLTAKTLGQDVVQGKSYHHQAVDQVGAGLRAVGKSEDGIVEAIEDVSGKWIVGIQWHPERTPEDPASRNLFREFVQRAAQYKEEKESCGTW